MVAFCQLDNGGGGVSNANQAFPDWSNGFVYSWNFGSPIKLLKNSLTDGSLVSSSPIATVLAFSSNNHVKDHSCTILNGFMYAVTTNNSGIGNIKLSKIDLSTLLETASLAISLFSIGGISADQFSIVAKNVGGTDYLAILLNNSSHNPNFEIVNATTMASVVTGQYPHNNGFTMLATGPVVSTTWTTYAWAWESFTNPSLISMAFNTSGNTLTPATIKSYVPSDFVGPPVAWDEFDDFANFCYDVSDGHLICQGNGGQSDWGSILFNVFKVHSGTGAILWNTIAAEPVGDEYGSVQASFNDLTDGTYVYMDYLARLYKIDTSDGSVVGGFPYHTQHFAGGSVAWAWNSTDNILVYKNDGDFQDTSGYSIFRPDEAPTQRWALAKSSGFFETQGATPYRDPAAWNFMYQFRTTHDDEGTNTDSGWELIKVVLKTGWVALNSPVWQFADVGNPFRTVINGAEVTSNTNLAGASGGDSLYLLMAQTPGTTDIAMFRFAKATLNVTAASAPYTLPGTINSYISFTCVSPDEAYVVNPYFLTSAHVNYAAVWTGDLSSFAFIDLSALGITSGNEVHQNAVFDAAGFLWLTTKTVTPGTYNPAIAQSKLWKLQVSPGPALAVVTSYTVPDNFQSYSDPQFQSTIFNYNITYNPITNKIALLYNYQYPGFGQQRNVILTFDIGSTTFSSPLDWGPEDGIVTTAPAWNETDKIATSTGPSDPKLTVVSVIDFSTSPPTKTDSTVIDEWDIPFGFWHTGAPFTGNAIYYSEGSEGESYFYITGTDTIQFDETFGFMDAVLLPVLCETWFPLLIDTGPSPDFDINSIFNVIADWNAGKIYSISFDEETVYTHNSTTGAFISKKTVAAICGISLSTYIPLCTARLGTDGFLYAMGTHGATGAARKANLRLSKIDPSTMTEVAIVTPYAVAHSGTYSLDDDWRLATFKLNGVDTIALMLAGSTPANIEFFNSALTSLTTFDYSVAGGEPYLIAGEQPTVTKQNLYYVTEDPLGSDNISFARITFDASGPSASEVSIAVLSPTDINPGWTGPLQDPDPDTLMFDPADNSLVFRVLNDTSTAGQSQTEVVKLDTVSGLVVWTVEISPNGVWNNSDADFSQAHTSSDLSSGTLIIPSPTSSDLYTITLATGAFTSAVNSNFDGVSYGGVYQAACWDSAQSRMLYYYQGTNDLSSFWPSGGWAVWGPCPSVAPVELFSRTSLMLSGEATMRPSLVLQSVQSRTLLALTFQKAVLAPPVNPPTPRDFECLVTVISQYSNSPILLKLLEDFCDYVDPTVDIDAFYSLIWNVDTAQGYGLDVWGRIVGVVRTLEIASIGDFFGFQEAGDAKPFDEGPFYNGPTSSFNFYLSDNDFRKLIFAKALSNISNGSIQAINQLLINLFGADGNVYVTDGNDMTMTYTFTFPPSHIQLAIVSQTGVLPKPVGVLATVVVPP